MKCIDLNADLGEAFGPWPMGDDEAMLAVVSSANVACGMHAGDPLVMRNTVRAALARGVRIGAHPGFADLQGFGRREVRLGDAELHALLIYQLDTLGGMLQVEGQRLGHVKPHGALSNMACRDAKLARVVVAAVQAFDPGLPLMAPALSALATAATAAGQPVLLEVFADRAYLENGELMPRSQPGAVLREPEACVTHVARMLEAGGIVTHQGTLLRCAFHSICVHGDDPHAVATAEAIRHMLEAAGYRITPPAAPGQALPQDQ